MRLNLLSFAITFGLATISNNAHAQQKTQTIIFEPGEIEGALNGPSGERVVVSIPVMFNPLVQIRAEFNQEMQDSINEIK